MTTFTGHDQPTWQGSFNLADVGGLDLRDGGVTRTGRVFRSGGPDYTSRPAAGVRRGPRASGQ